MGVLPERRRAYPISKYGRETELQRSSSSYNSTIIFPCLHELQEVRVGSKEFRVRKISNSPSPMSTRAHLTESGRKTANPRKQRSSRGEFAEVQPPPRKRERENQSGQHGATSASASRCPPKGHSDHCHSRTTVAKSCKPHAIGQVPYVLELIHDRRLRCSCVA